MAAKLKTEEGRAAWRRRKWIAQPPNGWIKNAPGLRQFSMRGLQRVRSNMLELPCNRRVGTVRCPLPIERQ